MRIPATADRYDGTQLCGTLIVSNCREVNARVVETAQVFGSAASGPAGHVYRVEYHLAKHVPMGELRLPVGPVAHPGSALGTEPVGPPAGNEHAYHEPFHGTAQRSPFLDNAALLGPSKPHPEVFTRATPTPPGLHGT